MTAGRVAVVNRGEVAWPFVSLYVREDEGGSSNPFSLMEVLLDVDDVAVLEWDIVFPKPSYLRSRNLGFDHQSFFGYPPADLKADLPQCFPRELRHLIDEYVGFWEKLMWSVDAHSMGVNDRCPNPRYSDYDDALYNRYLQSIHERLEYRFKPVTLNALRSDMEILYRLKNPSMGPLIDRHREFVASRRCYDCGRVVTKGKGLRAHAHLLFCDDRCLQSWRKRSIFAQEDRGFPTLWISNRSVNPDWWRRITSNYQQPLVSDYDELIKEQGPFMTLDEYRAVLIAQTHCKKIHGCRGGLKDDAQRHEWLTEAQDSSTKQRLSTECFEAIHRRMSITNIYTTTRQLVEFYKAQQRWAIQLFADAAPNGDSDGDNDSLLPRIRQALDSLKPAASSGGSLTASVGEGDDGVERLYEALVEVQRLYPVAQVQRVDDWTVAWSIPLPRDPAVLFCAAALVHHRTCETNVRISWRFILIQKSEFVRYAIKREFVWYAFKPVPLHRQVEKLLEPLDWTDRIRERANLHSDLSTDHRFFS